MLKLMELACISEVNRQLQANMPKITWLATSVLINLHDGSCQTKIFHGEMFHSITPHN